MRKKKKALYNNTPAYQIRQDYINILKKNSVSGFVNIVKTIEQYSDLVKVVEACKSFYPPLKKRIEGVLFPKSIIDMCEEKKVFYRPESLRNELNWLNLSLRNYQDEIVFFLSHKQKFEHALLSGNYGMAHHVLDTVKARIGESLWFYEARFLLLEYEDKTDKAVSFFSDLLKECRKKSGSYVPYLLSQLATRTTKDLSAYKYDTDLKSQIKKNKNDLHEDYYKYLLFRLNFFNQYNGIDMALPILFESVFSLIDRYLICISTLKITFLKKEDDKSISDIVKQFYVKYNDPELVPLLMLSGNRDVVSEYVNNDFIDILTLYYCGKYEKCLEMAAAFLNKDSHIFDVYIIYCRCLVYQGKPFVRPLNGENVPINYICKNIYQIIVNIEPNDSLDSLYKINKNLYSFHIAASFDYFVKKEQNLKVDARVCMLYMDCFDPKYSELIQTQLSQQDASLYLDTYNNLSTKVLVEHQRNRLENIYENNPVLSDSIAKPYNALVEYNNGNLYEAFHLWKNIYESTSFVPLQQKAVRYMIKCLFEDGKINEAVKLYVDFFVSDSNLVSKVDSQSIINYMKDNVYEGIRRNMDLTIFVSLTCNTNIDKSCMLLEYCELCDKLKASELLDDFQELTPRAEIFFYLATEDETLRNYVNIRSFRERLEERERILLYLVEKQTARKTLYELDLKEVQDALVVYNVSKTIEESKIYANTGSIVKYKLKDIDGLYKRYLTYYDMLVSNRTTLYVLDPTRTFVFKGTSSYGKVSDTDVSINSNGIYEVFNSIYEYIKEQYLYSEFGLVAYLSTRVRHGVLEGELRPELANTHLILSESHGSYLYTRYWAREYELNQQDNAVINEALIKFSRGFDNEVIYLIKEILQIKDDNKPNGLFVYEPTPEEITHMAVEIGLKCQDDSKEEFCMKVMDWLWQMTDASLAQIRSYIAEQFSVKIANLFDDLKNEIDQDLPIGYAKRDLMKNIDVSSSTISGKIKKIENWFYVSGIKLENVDYEDLTRQTIKSVEVSCPQYHVVPELFFEGSTFDVKHSYVIHFADLIRNVVSNIIKHGVEADDGLKHFLCKFVEDGNLLLMHFENDIVSGSEETLNAVINEKLQSHFYIKEGGSGISKIKKIIMSDMRHNDNVLIMKALDGKCVVNITISKNVIKADE